MRREREMELEEVGEGGNKKNIEGERWRERGGEKGVMERGEWEGIERRI